MFTFLVLQRRRSCCDLTQGDYCNFARSDVFDNAAIYVWKSPLLQLNIINLLFGALESGFCMLWRIEIIVIIIVIINSISCFWASTDVLFIEQESQLSYQNCSFVIFPDHTS